MVRKGLRRNYQNLIRAIISGILYTIALRAWTPEEWPHFFSAFMSAIIIVLNAIDPVYPDKAILKRKGVVALVSCFVISIFHEIVNAIPEQLWWRNAILVSILGSVFVIRYDSLIPPSKNIDKDFLKLRDFILVLIDSLGGYRALKCLFKDEFLAIFCVTIVVVCIMTEFSKSNKLLRENQIRIAVVVILATSMLITFVSTGTKLNVYISLICGLGIINPVLTYMLGRVSLNDNKEAEKEDESASDDVSDKQEQTDTKENE